MNIISLYRYLLFIVYVIPLVFCVIVFIAIWLIGVTGDTAFNPPRIQEVWPQICHCCGLWMESPEDRTQWHGLGNCVEICSRCLGSGEEPKESPRVKWDNANQLGMFLDQHINVLRLVETGQITVKRAIEALCILRAGNTTELPKLEYRKLDRD